MEISKYTQQHFYKTEGDKVVGIYSIRSFIKHQLKALEEGVRHISRQFAFKGPYIGSIVSHLEYDYERDYIILDLKVNGINETDNLRTKYHFMLENTCASYLQDFSIGQTIEEIVQIIKDKKGKAKAEDFQLIAEDYSNSISYQAERYSLEITSKQINLE